MCWDSIEKIEKILYDIIGCDWKESSDEEKNSECLYDNCNDISAL